MPPHASTLLSHLRRLASPPDSDAALLARWVGRRDEAAFAALVSRHGPMVLGLCRRILGDAQSAEDVFQATFLVLARKAGRVHRPEALASFLYGVALRLACKARGAARRRPLPLRPDLPEPTDPRPDPLDALSGRELLALLDDEIARLPRAYRLPILLCVLQERSVEEAARLLGWSAGSLRGRLARGRERLRQRLARRGLAPSLGAVALLAPVVVPERLRAECVRNLSAPSPAVDALAAPAASLKVKAICLGLLVVALGLGIGLSLPRAPQPQAPAAAAPPQPAPKDETRRDRQGDPLPPGAIARLGTVRFRSSGGISWMTFAPDGKALAVSSRNGLLLMDVASGKRIRTLSTVETPPRSLLGIELYTRFSPDGKSLLSQGYKATGRGFAQVVHVWDLSGGGGPQEHDLGERIVWLGWSAEGQALAVRVEKGALHLHDLTAGRSRRFACEKLLQGPAAFSFIRPPVACSPAGRILAAGDDETVIHLWDIATGQERGTLRPKGAPLRALSVSPDGRQLVSVTSQIVQVWDVASAKVQYELDSNAKHVYPLFTSDGKTLVVMDSWQLIRFVDAATGRERGRTQGTGDFGDFTLSRDGKWLATATRFGSAIQFWDLASGQRRAAPQGHTNRASGSFAPDGRRVVSSGGGTFRTWDARSGEPLLCLQPDKDPAQTAFFSADGRSLFAAWFFGPPVLLDAATGQRRRTFPVEDRERTDALLGIRHMHLSDDATRLTAFSYYYPGRDGKGRRYNEILITGWDVAIGKELFRRRRPGMDFGSALSADGRVLAEPHPASERGTGLGEGPMQLEDTKTGELLLMFPKLPGSTTAMAFSPDGRLLALSNHDPSRRGKKDDPFGATGIALRVWETATATEVLALPLGSQLTAFSADGRLLAMTTPEEKIIVWDLARGRELRRFRGFDDYVVNLNFSPDGRRLISGLSDSTLLVWDVGPYPRPAGKLEAEAAAKAWTDLASTDAPRAFRARGTLASAPDAAVALLKEHLRAARPADAQRLRRLLTDLESEQLAVREKAQGELEDIGDLAEPALRQALADKPSLELRRRVQAVLERLRGPVTRPEVLRALRAVAVLEGAGTPAARRLLEEVAAGAPEARQTREAKVSLERLQRKPANAR